MRQDLGLRFPGKQVVVDAGQLGQEWPATVEEVWDEWLTGAGVSFEKLLASDERWLPPPAQRGRHESINPESGEPHGFATPSGKVELRSRVLETRVRSPSLTDRPLPYRAL